MGSHIDAAWRDTGSPLEALQRWGRRRWQALPPRVRSPSALLAAGLGLAVILLLAFYMTVAAAVERGDTKRSAVSSGPVVSRVAVAPRLPAPPSRQDRAPLRR